LSRQCGAIDRDKQNAILEAAIDLAGSANPSLAAIASRARVSRQTVYNQFGGAQGVRRAILNWCEAALREPFENFPAQSDTRTALAAYAESALRHMGAARYHRAIRAVGRVLPDDKTLANAICAEISEACTSSLRDFLEREMRAGRLKGADPDEAAAEFRAMTVTRTQLRMLAGLFDAAEIGDASKEARTAADRFLRLYGCEREKPWPPTRGRRSNDRRVENQP
jgi:AcrR family transcriptional regulator